MTFGEVLKRMFSKKETEVYTPQREYIDRRHDNLQRQLSFYEKKRQIPIMEERVKRYEKEVYGNSFQTRDDSNILKTPNHFRLSNRKFQKKGGMLT